MLTDSLSFLLYAQGLRALHSDDVGWIHADLELKNILLEVDGTGSMPRAVLADFGVALKIDKDKKVRILKTF
jgi:serine/threonine protein kinase